MQGDGLEPHLQAVRPRMLRNRAIGREQGELPMAPGIFVKRFDQARPSFALGVVDLAEIQHLMPEAQRLLSAIFQQRCSLPSLKRRLNRRNMMRINLPQSELNRQILGLHYKGFAISLIVSTRIFRPKIPKIAIPERQLRKLG
jgi:hypothetical protein